MSKQEHKVLPNESPVMAGATAENPIALKQAPDANKRIVYARSSQKNEEHCDNRVITSKFKWWNFVPLFLYAKFRYECSRFSTGHETRNLLRRYEFANRLVLLSSASPPRTESTRSLPQAHLLHATMPKFFSRDLYVQVLSSHLYFASDPSDFHYERRANDGGTSRFCVARYGMLAAATNGACSNNPLCSRWPLHCTARLQPACC